MFTTTDAQQRALADLMDFGRVIRVHDDGTAVDVSNKPSPTPQTVYVDEVQYLDLDANGGITGEPEPPAGWEYLRFVTGEYGVGRTAIMHPSNVIVGGIAETILTTPGYYVTVIFDCIDMPDDTGAGIPQNVGWGTLRYVGTTD